jgi:1,2-diacylglycerol 3-alpha-glucosyltransferase
MRILLTSPTYPPFISGLGNAVAQQAKGLAKAGHEVVVATGGNQRRSIYSEGILIETFPITGADYFFQPIRGDAASYINFLCKNSWDIVLLNAWQNWATDLALQNLDKISGYRFVYSHCISTNVLYSSQPLRSVIRYIAWRPYWWRLPQFMRRLDGLLFLAGGGSDSRFDDFRLARRLGLPLQIVPNSISSEATTALSKQSRSLETRDQIMAVGSYQWQKGFDFVLRAFAGSQARHRFVLHIYGQEHSAYSSALRSLARRLGLGADNVIFHAGIFGEELVNEYCKARIVLSGSHTECQPLALLDASATGTPFIARKTGCISTMPGGISVVTPKEMAYQLDTLVDDTLSWQLLSDEGRHAAREVYHPNQTIKQLLAALKEMGASQSAGLINE